MHNEIHHRELRCAARQGTSNHRTTFRWPAPGAFGRRALAALLSVALLGAASVEREFDLSILERRLEGSASTIRVKQGQTVWLRWRCDEPVSLHVHGYDLRANPAPSSPASMRFEARAAGRFPITAHGFGTAADHGTPSKGHREKTLLYLEVLPE